MKEDYYFQMFYDDLPIWGFIGKMEKLLLAHGTDHRYYLFTHVHFDIAFNGDRIIEINVSTDPSQVSSTAQAVRNQRFPTLQHSSAKCCTVEVQSAHPLVTAVIE